MQLYFWGLKPTNLRILLVAALLLFSFSLQAQYVQITGLVKDTVDKKSLEKASVLIISKKDSTLQSFVRTDKQGRFSIEAPAGSIVTILVSYPKYADWYDDVEFPSTGSKDLGVISLNTKAYVLQEIVIKNTSPIRMKGDTTEYTADSFKVTPNADVQALLRKMPGIQVNAKGEITAQGEKVKKVFVDGEEFFSDDPAVVTKNLRADAIEKVQVYDKKSDQAAFTGIDDGQREKTINLKLKESAKNGYFGKIEAGSTLAKYNVAKLMANSFKEKRKLSGYVTTNNSSFDGLDWSENRSYGDGGNTTTEVNDDGGVMIMVTSGDEDYAENKGLPNQQTAGLFYGNKWNTFSTGNSAQAQRMQMDILQNGATKTILPDFTLNNTFSESKLQDRKRYKLGTKNEWGTDSTGLFKFNLNASQTLRSSFGISESNTYKNNTTPINSSTRKLVSDDKDNMLNGNVSFRQKYAKKGRSISMDASWRINEKTSTDSLLALNTFIDAPFSVRSENINQFKTGDQQAISTNVNAAYTEPISKKSFLIFKYNFALGTNEAERKTLSGAGAIYDKLVDSLSNHFRFNTFSNSGSLNYRYAGKKITVSFGSGLGRVNYRSNDLETLAKRSVSFTNFLPVVGFTFKPKQQQMLNIDYTGKTENPMLSQIQPLIDNTNPLFLQIGNPNLVQGFRNDIRLRYNNYKVLQSKNIYIQGGYSQISNAISTSSFIDATGKNISQYVNVNGNYNYDVFVNHSRDIFKGINAGVGLQQYGGRNNNVVNGLKNATTFGTYRISFDLSYWGDKWYSFNGSFRVGQTTNRSSIRPGFKNTFTNMNGYLSMDLSFKKAKTYVGLWADYTYYGTNDLFTEPLSMFLFNPTVRKTFGKSESLEAKVSVFDLFNKNRDINRNASSNFLSQTTYNTIRRFVMFSVVYNFKSKSAATK